MLVLACGVIALLYGGWLVQSLLTAPARRKCEDRGDSEGAAASGPPIHDNRDCGAVIFVAAFAVLGWQVAVGFLIGAVLSGAAGFIGMNVSVRANVRTAQAAHDSRSPPASTLAFKAGAITGHARGRPRRCSASPVYFVILTDDAVMRPTSRVVVDALVALGFGASLISIFARLGGGIFTKGADVGADLVGKVEAGIPEDDPRNPADHRRQRRRQCRRLRRHGRRPVRDLCGDRGRHHGARRDLLRRVGRCSTAMMLCRSRSAASASSPRSSAPSSSSSAPAARSWARSTRA
jgi:K(+)-stimulated pyrophosphate-energized sodium pump